MEIERRKEPRWGAHSLGHKARVRHEDGSCSEALIIDVSRGGIGIRADRRRFHAGARVGVEIDLSGTTLEVPCVVRFVDRFFPRIGLVGESPAAMDEVVEHARRVGFLMFEVRHDTLAVHGRLTLAAKSAFKTAAQRVRKLDLAGVEEASVAGAAIVLDLARRGARIDRCSGAIAPLFDSLGICRANVCTSADPCDLPKKWPLPPAADVELRRTS